MTLETHIAKYGYENKQIWAWARGARVVANESHLFTLLFIKIFIKSYKVGLTKLHDYDGCNTIFNLLVCRKCRKQMKCTKLYKMLEFEICC